MKKYLFGAVAALSFTSAAYAGEMLSYSGETANGFDFVGEGSYAFEAENFRLDAGGEYVWNDFVRVTGVLQFDDDNASDNFEYSGASLQGAMTVVDDVEGFLRVDFDDDFDHDETTLGVSFRF